LDRQLRTPDASVATENGRYSLEARKL
jgi:hypothetical protein